jgi:hypothetical protein
MKIIALDPSGSFNFGNGTTGWCIIEKETEEILETGMIKAKDFETKEEYFKETLNLIKNKNCQILIIENFILYEKKAATLFNQELETSELIGYLYMSAQENGILQVVKQNAILIKTRLKEENVFLGLVNRKQEQIYFKKNKKGASQWYWKNKRISKHILDSIKHAFYYLTKLQKEK